MSRLVKAFGHILRYARTRDKGSTRYVGKDHLGNLYFEVERHNNSYRPVRRFFTKSKDVQSFDDVVEAANVPPLWDAWLRFRRDQPPTEKELRDSEEYFQMQQAKTAEKREKPDDTSSMDEGKPNRKVPPGAYNP